MYLRDQFLLSKRNNTQDISVNPSTEQCLKANSKLSNHDIPLNIISVTPRE